MLRREFTRIGILGGIGLLIMLFVIFGSEDGANWSSLIIPIYVIGMFYAGKILLKVVGTVTKTYFSCQFISLLINPLWGTVICVILLGIGGIAVIFSFGWLIGIGRCICCLISAYQLDRECPERQREYY